MLPAKYRVVTSREPNHDTNALRYRQASVTHWSIHASVGNEQLRRSTWTLLATVRRLYHQSYRHSRHPTDANSHWSTICPPTIMADFFTTIFRFTNFIYIMQTFIFATDVHTSMFFIQQKNDKICLV